MSDDLVMWLRGCLDEDERIIRWAIRDREEDGSDWWWDEPDPTSGAEHMISAYNPARVLREVEAKRRIIDLYEAEVKRGAARPHVAESVARHEAIRDALLAVIRIHAAAISDRPGYRQEWAPS